MEVTIEITNYCPGEFIERNKYGFVDAFREKDK